jgi:crotonobetainyl-CoA:carnitine CoA-transferase CaiB-like acyl-CoA transferase
VIKVEPPSGELWRHAHNLPPQPVAEDAYPWHLTNRNKRGMALDLKSPSAQQVLEKLVKWTDVLIVNRPFKAASRGTVVRETGRLPLPVPRKLATIY